MVCVPLIPAFDFLRKCIAIRFQLLQPEISWPAHAPARKWTREELLVALNLYRKLSFGQLHARNPVIIELAAPSARGATSL
jgi:hypothetical protein